MSTHSPSRRLIIKVGISTPVVMTAGCLSQDGSGSSAAANRTMASGQEPTQFRTPRQIAPLFLTDAEFKTLEAVVESIVPADDNPGARDAQCARGVQLLLSAFSFSPAMIFAGGPFSNRGGHSSNDFEKFIELDPYEELAWRIKIEGSKGMPARSFNGAVAGWQTIYRNGLAALNASAAQVPAGGRFEQLPAPLQQLILQDSRDSAVTDMLNIATPQVLELMYGAPEYGGNAALVGWKFTDYEGDVQPRGYTRQQVVEPDNPGVLDMLGLSRRRSADQATTQTGRSTAVSAQTESPPQSALLPVPTLEETLRGQNAFRQLIAMTSDEFGLAMMIDSQSNQQRIRQFVQSKLPNKSGVR